MANQRPRSFGDYQERKNLDASRKRSVETVLKNLMNTDMLRIKAIRDDLIRRNNVLTNSDAFYHRGQIYTLNTQVGYKPLTKHPIHPSLRDEMFEYEKQIQEFKNDKVILEQGLGVLVRNAMEAQDIRDALPDILLPCMGSPEHLMDRTRPELYTLTSELHRHQYEKTLDKIYFYLGSRLLG